MRDDHETLTVRVPVEAADALRRSAQEGDRSLSAEIRRALRQHIAGIGGGGDQEGATSTAATASPS